jgi:hypothetical protein
LSVDCIAASRARRSPDEANGFVIHTSPPPGADATQNVHICEASLVVWAKASAATNPTERRADIEENCMFPGSSVKGTARATVPRLRRLARQAKHELDRSIAQGLSSASYRPIAAPRPAPPQIRSAETGDAAPRLVTRRGR